MALDQIHEQNKRTIKLCGRATDLVNKVDKLALIFWETWGLKVARFISEFKEWMNLDISSDLLEFVKIAFDTKLNFHLILKLTTSVCK